MCTYIVLPTGGVSTWTGHVTVEQPQHPTGATWSLTETWSLSDTNKYKAYCQQTSPITIWECHSPQQQRAMTPDSRDTLVTHAVEQWHRDSNQLRPISHLSAKVKTLCLTTPDYQKGDHSPETHTNKTMIWNKHQHTPLQTMKWKLKHIQNTHTISVRWFHTTPAHHEGDKSLIHTPHTNYDMK